MSTDNSCILCRGIKIPCINDGDLTQPCQRCHRLDLPCAYSKKRRRLKASERESRMSSAVPSSHDMSPAHSIPGGDSLSTSSSSSSMQPPSRYLTNVDRPPSTPTTSTHPQLMQKISPGPGAGGTGTVPGIGVGAGHGRDISGGSSGASGTGNLISPSSTSQGHASRSNAAVRATSITTTTTSSSSSSSFDRPPSRPGSTASPQHHYPAHPPSGPGHPASHASALRHAHAGGAAAAVGPPSSAHARSDANSPNYPHPHPHSQSQQSPAHSSVAAGHAHSQSHASAAAKVASPAAPGDAQWEDLERCASIVVNPGEKVLAQAQEPGGAAARGNMLDDPIVMGYLTEHEAERMFEIFYEYLNTEIAMLDPELHTFEYVRQKSPLLFSAILGATAKFFNKEVFPSIWAHAQRLVSRVVEQGACSPPIIQALLILVYWKQPNDRSAWIKTGLAVRMGYQLGWHNGWTTPMPEDPILYRERLDAQRTWFCCVAFDKTYAGVFNLPATIRAHEFGDMESWVYEHDHLDISNDLRLCCCLQTLIFMDMVTAWRAECRTMSRTHALLQIERLCDSALQLQTKWCNRGVGLPRGMSEKQKAMINYILQHVIFLLRFASLAFIPANQVELVLSDCVDRAMIYLDKLRIVADIGSWAFQQDIASAKMASFCATLQELYWRASPGQRHLVLKVLKEIHVLCCAVADNDPVAPMAFVARYTDRLLSTMVDQPRHSQSAEAQASRPQSQQYEQQKPQLSGNYLVQQQRPALDAAPPNQPLPSVSGLPSPIPSISIPQPNPDSPYSYTQSQTTQSSHSQQQQQQQPHPHSHSQAQAQHIHIHEPHTQPQQSSPSSQHPNHMDSAHLSVTTPDSLGNTTPDMAQLQPNAQMQPPGPVVPGQAAPLGDPTEGLAFGDLGDISELLGMTGMLIGSKMAEEQYWQSLFANLPLNDVISL